jgi:hypothetical protein
VPVRHSRGHGGNFGLSFQFFQRQFELLDLERQLLRRLAEGHPPELGKLEAKRLDQRVANRQSGFQLGDPGVLVEGGRSLFRHTG